MSEKSWDAPSKDDNDFDHYFKCCARQTRRADEAERLLRNLVEADEAVITASYCEYCDSHADKNNEGELIAPVLHSAGCPIKEARAFLKAGDPK